MINRLPLTVGFARVSQATEDQGNLETQTRQLQDHGVHELVTEIGSGAGSDRRALRDLQARLQAGDTLVVTAIDRISRRAVDGLRFIRDVTGAGIYLVVLSQREFDTTTPTGQLLLHLTLAAERLVEENNQSGSCPKGLPMDQSAGHLTEPRHRRT